jgi:hypothetical protein
VGTVCDKGLDNSAGTVRDKGLGKAAGTVREKGLRKAAGSVREKGQDKSAGTVRDNKNGSNRTTYGQAPGGAANHSYKLADDGEHNAFGGVTSSVNSGTIEVSFMIDSNRRCDFNLCMRLREFIVEARAMNPAFSILSLGGNGGKRSPNQKNGQTQKKE